MCRFFLLILMAVSSLTGCGPANPKPSNAVASRQSPRGAGPAPAGPAAQTADTKKKRPVGGSARRLLRDKPRYDRIAAVFYSRRFKPAIKQFEEYLKEYPEDKEAWTLLGHAHRNIGRLQLAETAYSKAIALDPVFASALIGLAVVYRERGEFRRSREKYELAHLSDASDERPLIGLALLALRMYEDEAAVSYAERAVQISKADAEAASVLAIAYHHVGDTRKRDRMAAQAKKLGYSNPGFLEKVFANKVHFRADLFQPKGAEWAIPVKPPRPPVLLADYKRVGRNSLFDESSEGVKMFRRAERFMFIRRHSEAEEAFATALKLAPKLAVAAYQRSCNFALWGKPKKAKEMFDMAVKLGFADYPFCYRDLDLGVVRAYREFQQQLKTIRTRFETSGANRVGIPIVVTPTEEKAPRPLLVLLHGYGDTHEAYLRRAKAWARLGFVVVAMPGSIPRRSGGFIWDEASVETTHKQLQLAIHSPLVSQLVDRRQVYLLGFSQGAMHAWQVVIRHPDKYAGVVAVSPGGRPWHKSSDQPKFAGRKPRFWFTFGNRERSKAFITERVERYRQIGVPFRTLQHPGAHHFPRRWSEFRPAVAKFLLKQEPPTKNPFDD